MEEHTRTGMPRAALPSGDRSGSVVLWIAFAVSALFVVAQIGFAVTYVPVMLYAYETAGLELNGVLAFADLLGPFGIVAFLSVVDIAVFAAFTVNARRHWVGLLFVPPLIYILIAFVLLASGFGGVSALLS